MMVHFFDERSCKLLDSGSWPTVPRVGESVCLKVGILRPVETVRYQYITFGKDRTVEAYVELGPEKEETDG